MLRDRFNLAVTTDTPEALAALNTYAEEFLGYGANLGAVIAAAEAHPDCLALQSHAAAVHMALEAAGGLRAAQVFIERQRLLRAQGTEREGVLADAVEAWAARDPRQAAFLFANCVERWPNDLVAAKWGQYHAFNLGDSWLMRRLGEMVVSANAGEPFAHGLYAFALEQTHDLERAELEGRRAIEIEKRDAWAHHAVAHVMETRGRVDEGLIFMHELAPLWDDRSVFIREHNWWHVALFHLDRDEPEAALDIFDRRLWGEWPEFGQEQIGAVSALWRMELRGIDVGNRWEAVAAAVAERELEHVLPFHDLHYLYALARTGREEDCAAFLSSLKAHAWADHPEAPMWREVALPIARSLVAFAGDDFESAVEGLTSVSERLQEIGGSHAQRDVFVQTRIESLMRTQRFGEAAQILEARARARPAVLAVRRLFQAARAAWQGAGSKPAVRGA